MRTAQDEGGPRIIWAEPLRSLVIALRTEASGARATLGQVPEAARLDTIAGRIEGAIQRGATCEWVLTEDAAALLHIKPDSVRAACRRERLRSEKRGGLWYVHVSALAGQSDAKAA